MSAKKPVIIDVLSSILVSHTCLLKHVVMRVLIT